MQKKAIYSILSVVVAMVVLSVTMVLAIGPHVSAYTDENRIFVLKEWDDFEIRDDYYGSGSKVCMRISDKIGCDLLGYDYSTCGYYYGNSQKALEYDEIHIEFPHGITDIYNYALNFWGGVSAFEYKVTSIIIPESVVSIGGQALQDFYSLTSIVIPASVEYMGQYVIANCQNLKTVYCECSEEYANEHWNSEWLDNYYYQWNEEGQYNEEIWPTTVIWNCNKTITFDTQDGSVVESQKVCVDSLVTKPADPEKAGYTFKGWYNGDEAYDFTTPVSEDLTLTAQWEEITTEPENTDSDTEVNNQNNIGLIWGIGGTSAGVLVIGGIVVGVVISKRRRK